MDWLIVVAGGKGLRMGGDVPKQFQLLAGRPVLMHTLENLHRTVPEMQLVLVLPADQQDYWAQLCAQYAFDIPLRIATGGETRFHSVRNGLALIPPEAEGVIGVHDGVRPFVSPEVVRATARKAAACGAAIPVVPVVETVRHREGTGSRTVNRDEYCLVQTPQFFRCDLLRRAYAQPFSAAFTDDASVVEALGHPVELTEGNRENIKITTPFDKTVGELLVGLSHV